MPQLFTPRANVIMKSALVAVLVLGVVAILLMEVLTIMPYVTAEGLVPKRTRVGFTPPQPIPFSHKHHVGDVGLDCRYCHTSVKHSSFAGMPPTHTCMTCHSQFLTQEEMLAPVRKSLQSKTPLQWQSVTKLPDYVYFNHSIHVAKGIGCVSCHGRIDKMPLTRMEKPFTMAFCLNCHRHPKPHLRPESEIFSMTWQRKGSDKQLGTELMSHYHIDTRHLTDCYTCHR